MHNTTSDAALHYAADGWRVIPIPSRMKRPVIKEWPKVASNDPNVVSQMFEVHDGNIGVVCGAGSGIVVIDIDLPDGPETIKALEAKFGPLPETRTQRTGRGGWQRFYGYPVGRDIRGTVGAKGNGLGVNVDVRAEGSQVVVPPSIHPNGNSYAWEPHSR